MTDAEQSALREDFLTWSGGFDPESMHQITVYLDYACESSLDREGARDFLITWMNRPDSMNGISSA